MDSNDENTRRSTRPNSHSSNGRFRRLRLNRTSHHSPPPTPQPYAFEEGIVYEIPYLYVPASIDNLEKKLDDCAAKLVSLRRTHNEIEQEMELVTKAIKFYNANEKTESNCTICLEELTKSDIAVLPNCCHVFHVGCLRTWFASSLSCPTCRHRALNTEMRRVSAEQAKMFEDLSVNDRLKLVEILQVN